MCHRERHQNRDRPATKPLTMTASAPNKSDPHTTGAAPRRCTKDHAAMPSTAAPTGPSSPTNPEATP